MNAADFIEIHGFRLGSAKRDDVQKVIRATRDSECVQPADAHDLTGKPDQYLAIPQALKLIGCEPL